jgi:hypothetical protein
MENEPVINFTYGGYERQFRRDNTTLFTFLGQLAMYNHVFTTFDKAEEDEEQKGMYVYKAILPDQYARLEEFIVDNEFPQILNMPRVSEMDAETLHNALAKDLSTADTFPEDWDNGEA